MTAPTMTSLGFTLFSNDPYLPSADTEICLSHADKICDHIASWENTYRRQKAGFIDDHSVPKISLKRFFYFLENDNFGVSSDIENVLYF